MGTKYHSGRHKELQNDLWSWYTSKIKELGHFDLLVSIGDLVEGNKIKDNLDLYTANIKTQTEIAIECIEIVDVDKMLFIRGTPFHTSNGMEAEELIAEYFNSEIYDEKRIEVNGIKIHYKHTTGKSGIPHGQLILKDMLWSLLKESLNDTEKSHIYCRAHAHEKLYIESNLGIGIINPCLKLPFENFGRKFNSWYNIGFSTIEIDDNGKIETQFYEYKYLIPEQIMKI
jgi:hypothetical protein